VKTLRAFFKSNKGRRPRRFAFLFLLTVFASGCSFGSKTTYSVNQYTLEYPSPVLKETAPIKEPIKVERFSVANAFDTSAIVYRDGPNLRNIDPYNRWRTTPGEMVTDFLIRDLRHSGLFRAIFSYHQDEETRYLLEGQVNEFLESKENDGLKAILSLDVTFLDLSKKEMTERIVFQRAYGYTEPLERETYGDLAQAISKAMEKFSRQMMMDLYQAVRASEK
jgi:cholesterol transport system auxiliary component